MSTQYDVEKSKPWLGPTVIFLGHFHRYVKVRCVLKMNWDKKITWMEGGHILPSQARRAWETRNPIGWWSAAATCLSSSSFSWHSQDEKVCEGKVVPRPRDVALKIGEFTSWARYSNRDAWSLKAVLGYVKPWETKERKGKMEKASRKTHQLLTKLGMLAKHVRACGQLGPHSDILSWKP